MSNANSKLLSFTILFFNINYNLKLNTQNSKLYNLIKIVIYWPIGMEETS